MIDSLRSANQAIAAIATWLETYTEPEDPANDPCYGEDKSAQLAREWCDQLLSASRANGLYGCRLCQL